MTPEILLQHQDSGQLWPKPLSGDPKIDVASAYQRALAVRDLRQARGEHPRGYKIGFTNRTIWPRYNVYAPIWGTIWDTTLAFCDGAGQVSLAHTCQPRLEPEIVFGMKSVPAIDAQLGDVFDAIEWVAPGFEVVQAHLPDWKFEAADTVADGALHARLLVGQRVPVTELACNAMELANQLARASVSLSKHGHVVELGQGSHVLDSPLHAMLHFVQALRQCPGAPDLQPGDVVTTGTWTDAWPISAGEEWSARFSWPDMTLHVSFTV